MIELIKTNDMVLLSFVEAVLKDARIDYQILDQNMSILEGSAGAIPRRLLVEGNHLARAKNILTDAGVGHELATERKS